MHLPMQSMADSNWRIWQAVFQYPGHTEICSKEPIICERCGNWYRRKIRYLTVKQFLRFLRLGSKGKELASYKTLKLCIKTYLPRR